MRKILILLETDSKESMKDIIWDIQMEISSCYNTFDLIGAFENFKENEERENK